MTVFFMGSEPEIFDTFNGSVTTHASVTIANQNRAGVAFLGTAQEATADFAAQTEGWLHFRFGRASADSYGAPVVVDTLKFTNVEGQSLFKMPCATDANECSIGILGQTAISLGVSSGVLDVNYKIAEIGGFVRVWLNNILFTQFNGDTRLASGTQSVSNMALKGLTGFAFSNNAYFSQFLISDMPTLNAKVITLPLTVSAVNEWDGTPANVTGTSNAGIDNAIKEQVINQRIRFNTANVESIAINEFIGGVSIHARALAEIGSPVTKIGWLTYNGTTELEVGTTDTFSTTFSNATMNMPVNPHTTNAWTLSELNAIELGIKAKA